MNKPYKATVLGLTEDEVAFKEELLETFNAYLPDSDGGRLIQIAIAVIANLVAAGTSPSETPDEDLFATVNNCFRENFQLARFSTTGTRQ